MFWDVNCMRLAIIIFRWRKKVSQVFCCRESVSKYLTIKRRASVFKPLASPFKNYHTFNFFQQARPWPLTFNNYQQTKRWWRDLGYPHRKTFPRWPKCGRWRCCNHPCLPPYQDYCCCCSSEFRDVHRWSFDGKLSSSFPAFCFHGTEVLIWRTCRDKRLACFVTRPQFPMCCKQK